MERIYLDSASTTRTDDEVIEAMLPFLRENYGNPSSIHSFGKTAKVMMEDARDLIASVAGVSSKQLVFTSGGTESINNALKGIAYHYLGKEKDHIITSPVEHSAVLETTEYLRSKFGFRVTYLKPRQGGAIDPEEALSAVTDKTFLVSLMHANNETGGVTDIRSISEGASLRGVEMFTDTVQSFGKNILDLGSLRSSAAVISAHKIRGPKGIAALYARKGTPVEKFIHGGKQERDLRGGTENIAAIAGFAKAVELAAKRFEEDTARWRALRTMLMLELETAFGDAVIFNSPAEKDQSLPNILNFCFDKGKAVYDEEMLIIMLDLRGIAVSGGSACTSGSHKPSHVLIALGVDERTALGAIRVSFGRENTAKDVAGLVDALKDIVKLR